MINTDLGLWELPQGPGVHGDALIAGKLVNLAENREGLGHRSLVCGPHTTSPVPPGRRGGPAPLQLQVRPHPPPHQPCVEPGLSTVSFFIGL